MPPTLEGFEAVTVPAGQWDARCLLGGRPDGPLALLLHGFPDSPATWRHVAPVLARRGWRVAMPWMPHYGRTIPARGGTGKVHPRDLAAFAVALRRSLRPHGTAVVVGHDWGAITANQVTATDADAFNRAVTLAVAPLSGEVFTSLRGRQIAASAYAAALAVPGGWRTIALGNWRLLETLWRRWSPGHLPDEVDRGGWKEALAHDGGRGAAGYYRAMLPALARRSWPGQGEQVPQIPTLHLAGALDGCVTIGMQRRGGEGLADHSRMVELPGAGHFLHLEEPDRVNTEIVDWLDQARIS